MLKLENLNVCRGKIHVLHDICMEVGRGEIVALIGANGAGKTTTLHAISGLLPVKSGTITLESEDGRPLELTRTPAEGIVAAGVCHCPEGRGVFARLSVHENLLMGAFLRRDNKNIRRDMEQICTMFPILATRQKQMAGTLSGGEQMMLAIGRALMGKPRLLILDEPSLGLAPIIVEKIFELITNINNDGVTILLVEQNAMAALKIANRGYVLANGRVIMAGSSQALLADDDVRKAYLGG